MLEILLDETAVEQQFLAALKKKLNEIEMRSTFWDMKELMKQTNMGESNIKEKFFYDSRFPKYKVGGKWYFPAKECEEFLLMWIKEQPKN